MESANYSLAVKPHLNALRRVIDTCLAAKNEKVLVIGDYGYENKNIAAYLSYGYYNAAKEAGYDARLVLQEPKQQDEEAETETIFSLADLPKGSAIIINVSSAVGDLKYLGKSIRHFAEKQGHRFIGCKSWGCIDNSELNNVISSLDIDYIALREKCKELKQQLDAGKNLRVVSEAGTDLMINIYGKKCSISDGIYTEPGTGGCMPAGEIYLPLKLKKHNGKVVLDGSIRTSCCPVVVKEPVTLTIENSEIKKIEGGEEAEALNRCIQIYLSQCVNEINQLTEFGIGLNPKLKLCSGNLIDEKAFGVCHIGHGNEFVHFNQTFRNARLILDGEEIVL